MLRDELGERDQGWCQVTYSKEDPLQHDTFIVTSGGEGEETFGVVLANEVEENSGAFKDVERLWFVLAVDEDGDATIGVESDKPWLLLTIGGEDDLLDAVEARSGAAWCGWQHLLVIYGIGIGGLELFEQDGDFVSVGGGSSVEQEGL